MPFVKLDCGILNSTLWIDADAREVFITALLMAEPRCYDDPISEIATREIAKTGFVAPPGWYGFVPAASVGILRTAGIDPEAGMNALERLASQDQDSRSHDYEGRRMIRVDGGFLILNYQKYRDRDYKAAERQRRYRLRKQNANGVTSSRYGVTGRNVTQAEAEAEAESKPERARKRASRRAPEDWKPEAAEIAWAAAECPGVDVGAETAKFLDHTFATARTDWPATWRNWIRRATPTRPVPKVRREPTEEEVSAARKAAAAANRAELDRKVGPLLR